MPQGPIIDSILSQAIPFIGQFIAMPSDVDKQVHLIGGVRVHTTLKFEMQSGISGEISLGGENSASTAELGTVYPVRTAASWKCLEIL